MPPVSFRLAGRWTARGRTGAGRRDRGVRAPTRCGARRPPPAPLELRQHRRCRAPAHAAAGVWPLLETSDGASILDRIEGGGLAVGEPGRLSVHGSSWTQTAFAIGRLDVTDPDRGGLPLVYPDLDALDAVEVTTAAASV